MKRYPSPKLAARMHFSYPKNSVKIRKTANILETAGSVTKSLKFQPRALILGVLQGMIIGFKLYRKNSFC